MLSADELLTRMAGILRHDIGPAVVDPFPKTQAFMASVVLEKLSAQLRHAAAHASADAADRATLQTDLTGLVDTDDPAELRDAVAALGGAGGEAALGRLVVALWASRDQLGGERFETLLTRVRRTLRARLDRQLEVAV